MYPLPPVRIILPFIGSLLFIAALSATVYRMLPPQPSHAPIVIDIGHVSPANIILTVTRFTGGTVLEFGNGGAEQISLLLPLAWKRGEVRGSSLEDIRPEPSTTDQAIWALPAATTIVFSTEIDVPIIRLRNSDQSPLTLAVTTVDVRTNEAKSDVFLLQKGFLDVGRMVE